MKSGLIVLYNREGRMLAKARYNRSIKAILKGWQETYHEHAWRSFHYHLIPDIKKENELKQAA